MEQPYQCDNCFRVFEESDIKIIRTTYENYYGIPLNEYQSSTSLELSACPYCEFVDIHEMSEEEYEEYLEEKE